MTVYMQTPGGRAANHPSPTRHPEQPGDEAARNRQPGNGGQDRQVAIDLATDFIRGSRLRAITRGRPSGRPRFTFIVGYCTLIAS